MATAIHRHRMENTKNTGANRIDVAPIRFLYYTFIRENENSIQSFKFYSIHSLNFMMS